MVKEITMRRDCGRGIMPGFFEPISGEGNLSLVKAVAGIVGMGGADLPGVKFGTDFKRRISLSQCR